MDFHAYLEERRKLVEDALVMVQLNKVIRIGDGVDEFRGHYVDRGHLRRKHGFEMIARLNAAYD